MFYKFSFIMCVLEFVSLNQVYITEFIIPYVMYGF